MSNSTAELELRPENTQSYWDDVWKNKRTGWKAFEKDHGVFETNIRAVGRALARHSEKATLSKDVLSSRRGVFIPLCGDTFATRFCVNGLLGVAETDSKSLSQINRLSSDEGERNRFNIQSRDTIDGGDHCRVVMGVDLAEEGIRQNMKNNFPEISFELLDEKDQKFAHFFARVSKVSDGVEKSSSEFVDIHLFAGDFFEVCAWWKEKCISPVSSSNGTSSLPYRFFDFCYDRASMVAMHPSQRHEYVVSIVSILTPTVGESPHSPIVFLELVVRSKESQERGDGPPFHIDENTVAKSAESQDATVDPTTATPTYYPLPWKRLPLDIPAVDEDPHGPPFKFKPHVLFVEQ